VIIDENINIDKTIAAIATPLHTGGISVIRISGKDAIEIAERVFKAKSGQLLKTKKGYTASYGSVFYNEKPIDEAVAVIYKSPKSYTGEDVVELSCHGGVYITREVLRAVIEKGAKHAGAGEFTKRALLNGKMSLTQAEAVIDMINSHNKQAMNSAKAQLDGALYKKIESVKNRLLSIVGHLAAWVDYPEEDIPEVEDEVLLKSLEDINAEMEKLLKTYDTGKLFKEGIETVIVGKPNVGKSTLMNLLVGEDKSIVTDIAGTTRDIIEESIMLGEIMLKLADTAGIRETSDIIESVGVSIARKRLDKATLVLAVFDYSDKLSQDDLKLIETLKDKLCIAIINKNDLNQKIDMNIIESNFKNIVQISARENSDAKALEDIISSEMNLNDIDLSSGMIANERQRECSIKASDYIKESISAVRLGITLDAVTVSIEMAIEALLELSGERITTAVVDRVFSNFCVGK